MCIFIQVNVETHNSNSKTLAAGSRGLASFRASSFYPRGLAVYLTSMKSTEQIEAELKLLRTDGVRACESLYRKGGWPCGAGAALRHIEHHLGAQVAAEFEAYKALEGLIP